MAGEQEREEMYRLSDLDVEAIGLVRRGANQKPFYFIKSVGGSDMGNEQEEETFASQLDELGEAEEVDAGWGQKLVEVLKSALAKPEPEPESEPEEVEEHGEAEPDEQFADVLKAEPDEAFAEMVAQARREIEEEFAQKLESERKAREVVAERFAEEQRKRRLREFSDMVGEKFGALPVGETEQFADDLMAFHDFDEERYGRLTEVLKAAQEAVEQGGLFEQYSSARPEEHGDPFEAAVERTRKEKFSDEDYAVGYAKALDVVMQSQPELAARYESQTRAQ